MEALKRARKSYQAYLQKKASSSSINIVNRSDQDTGDLRKIVFVKIVKPLILNVRSKALSLEIIHGFQWKEVKPWDITLVLKLSTVLNYSTNI
jgi:hypothetical protein